MSDRRGAQFVTIGIPTICWKTFPTKTRNSCLPKAQASWCHLQSTCFKNQCSFTKYDSSWNITKYLMSPDRMIEGILIFACLFVFLSLCLFVCLLSTLNLRYNFWTVRDRDFIFGMHAYSTNDALSNDTKVNDLVTLTLTSKLKIPFSTLLPPGHSVSQTHLDFYLRLPFLEMNTSLKYLQVCSNVSR